jgi:hypothetical protein
VVLDKGLVGRGLLGEGLATDAFRQRVSANADPIAREVASLEGSRLAGLASPSTGQERLLQQQTRYDAGQAAAEIYGYEDVASRGPVSTLFDFLSRGQSGFTGALTGFLGMEREGKEDRGPSFQEGLRRLGEGLAGEEDYRFSEFTDTGKRIARGEEVGTFARGWNTALGFVVDTVADPLTYVSFGGSIMGRMRAANAVRGASQNAVLAAAGKNTFDPVRFMNDAFKKNVTRTDKLALDINSKAKAIGISDVNLSVTSTFDDIVKRSGEVFRDSNVNLLREVAVDYIPDVAAMSYAQRSAAGLRRWSVDHFGKDAGEAYFRSLPQDIQGGIRIRLPFARNADGTPIAFGIDGIGAGRLGDKFAPFKKIEDLTQSGRDVAREFFEGTLGRFSGSSGAIYYDAVLGATGKRNKARTSTWVDYQGSRIMDESRKELRATFDEKFLKTHEVTAQLYARAKEQHGEKFQTRFKEFMYNTDDLDAYSKSRQFVSEAEELAFHAARSWRNMLDEIGKEAVEVFNGDANMAFHFLANYVPRITAKREETGRFWLSKGVGKPGTKPSYVKQRGQWAQSWGFDKDGNAIVLRWMPNEDIRRGVDKVYEVDPTVFMSVYLADVRSSLNEQKILNNLRSQNLLTQVEKETLQKIDEQELQRRIVQLVGPVDAEATARTGRLVTDTDAALKSKTFNVQKFENEISNPVFNYQPGGDPAVGNAMALYMQRMGIDIASVNEVNQYQAIDNALVNIIDNTKIIRTKSGRYVVVDEKNVPIYSNEEITIAGRGLIPGRKDRGVVREYEKVDQARAAWDEQQLLNRETIYYDAYLIEKKQEVFNSVSEIFLNPLFADVHVSSLAAKSDQEKTEYIEAWMNALKLFQLDEAQLVLTDEGLPAYARGPGGRSIGPLATEIKAPTEEFSEWIANAGYMNMGGMTFDENGVLDVASQIAVKQRISKQMVNDFAPMKLMENIQRMYKVTQAPQTAGAEIYNNIYKPLYTAQKAWMTLGRGPGFVIRNVLGGSWNNWINGVGSEQTLKSARMISAKTFAKREIGKKLKGLNILDIEPIELTTMYRDANRKYLSRYYSGDELDKTLEYWELFSRNGLGGSRDSARLYGELLRGQMGVGPQSRSALPNVRVSDAGEDIDFTRQEDLTKLERFLEFAAGDNYWIRDIMSPAVEISEDYLRFASFLKGIDEVGLEPAETGVRGYAAAQWVKATQFDYADLSDFEQSIKILVPFYSWTRNNVPLQIRVFIQQPGRVAQALRIHESLGNMFADEEVNISPSYISDRFGITFGEDNPFFDMLPKWMQPQGDVTMGIAWGEPIADVNTIFRDPTYSAAKGINRLINWREVFGQLNPIFAASSAAQQAISESSGAGVRNVEDAPRWARLGLAREDPTEPGSYVSNRALLDVIRNLVPVVDQAERVIPFLGGERQVGRWTTSVASNLFGLTLSTVDDWQKASEMQRRTDFIQKQMKDDFGPEWDYRNEIIKRLLAEGASQSFIRALNLQDINSDNVDALKAVHAWRFFRRMELLMENGTPEDEIIAALSAYAPEGSKVESLIQLIWDYVPKPSSDFQTGVRQFGLQPVTRLDLQELGLTVQDVRDMSEEQQRRLVIIVNRNKGWTGPQT